ncbi:MAG: ion channel [Cohaesibacteraceae bacterium]
MGGLFSQLVWGGLLVGLCAAIQIVIVASALFGLEERTRSHARGDRFSWMMIVLALAFLAVVTAHTIQAWLWAVALVWAGALTSFAEAIYFAIASYTTLGYGDIILGEEFRVFAAMSAVSGLLNFGLSTAFLLNVITEVRGRRQRR